MPCAATHGGPAVRGRSSTHPRTSKLEMDKLDMTLCSARPGAMAAAMLAGLSLLIVTGAALGDTVTAALEKGKDAVKWRLSGA